MGAVIALLLGTGIAGMLYAARHSNAKQPAGQQATNHPDPKTDTKPGITPKFDKTQHSATDPASPWVVVNKQHPLDPQNYAPADLTSVGNGQTMRAEAANALTQMFADAKTAGYTLVADSGYRSYNYQISTYNSIVKSSGQAYADSHSAHPGYSEHQTGWAVDIGSGNCHVADCFGDLPAGQWTAANAYKHGFILRYTKANSSVTGYDAEPWHFRYVGTVLSQELHTENVSTLEEFFNISGGAIYK